MPALLAAASVRLALAASMPLVLDTCHPGAPNQTFSLAVVPPFVNPAAVSLKALGVCLEIASVTAAAGSAVAAAPCGANAMSERANQYWAVDGGSALRSLQLEAPLCLGAPSGSGGSSGSGSGSGGSSMVLADCTTPAALFAQIGFDGGKEGALVHNATGLCVTAAGQTPALPPTPPPRPPEPPSTPCEPPAPSPPAPPRPAVPGDRPCDIYARGGTPCVAAHSVTRALYRAYAGPLYSVRRTSDQSSASIGVVATGGAADAPAQDAFCAGTDCVVQVIFDQSPRGNHLRAGHPGRHFPVDRGVNASAHPVALGGRAVYGAWFDPGMGYRNDNTSGVAVGQEPESLYAVFGGNHYNDVCCFGPSRRRLSSITRAPPPPFPTPIIN